jgi:hypothetical protein
MCQCAFFQTDLSDKQLMEYYDQTYPHYLKEEISKYEGGNWDEANKKVAAFIPYLNQKKFERFIEFGSSVPLVSARIKQLYPNLKVTCIDPNVEALEFGVRHGVDTRTPQDNLSFQGETSLVSLSHVIEHLPNPYQSLNSLFAGLNRGSTIIGAVPNWSSLLARATDTSWEWFAYPDHLFYFSPDSILILLKQLGLSSIKIWSTNEDDKSEIFFEKLGLTVNLEDQKLINQLVLGNELHFSAEVAKIL